MDDGVCLIGESRDGSRQLSGQVTQVETDDIDQAWAFLSNVDMILLTLKEMDIKRQNWVRDFLPEHKFLGSRGNIAWPHENFYVSNVNENYFSEFLALYPMRACIRPKLIVRKFLWI